MPPLRSGLISAPEAAEEIIANQRADLVTLGRILFRSILAPARGQSAKKQHRVVATSVRACQYLLAKLRFAHTKLASLKGYRSANPRPLRLIRDLKAILTTLQQLWSLFESTTYSCRSGRLYRSWFLLLSKTSKSLRCQVSKYRSFSCQPFRLADGSSSRPG